MNNLIQNGLPLIVATVISAALLYLVKQLATVTKGVKSIPRLEEGLRTLFVVNDKQNHVQQSTLEVTNAILDAIKTGKCNGNIDTAKERNKAALQNAKDAREAAQDFLIDNSVGKGA